MDQMLFISISQCTKCTKCCASTAAVSELRKTSVEFGFHEGEGGSPGAKLELIPSESYFNVVMA